MPYKSEKIKLSETQDRRRKLTTEQKAKIVELYETGLYSWNQLAGMFHCSKSCIGIIVSPKRAEKVRNRTKEHWRDYQKKGSDWNEIVREHRHYKQKLYVNGELETK